MKGCRDMGMVMVVKKMGDWRGNGHSRHSPICTVKGMTIERESMVVKERMGKKMGAMEGLHGSDGYGY